MLAPEVGNNGRADAGGSGFGPQASGPNPSGQQRKIERQYSAA